MDGRAWLQSQNVQYDVILLNLPVPSTALINRFYTQEFFTLAREHLTAEGVLALSLPSSPNYFGPALLLRNGSILRTLRSVFAEVKIAPIGRNLFLSSATPGSINLDPQHLGRLLASLEIHNQYLKAEVIPALLPHDRMVFVEEQLSKSGAELNRDFTPAAYFYHTFFWSELSDPALAPWLRAVLGPWRYWPFILPLLAAALVWGIIQSRPLRKWTFPLGFSAFTSGWSAMSLQYLILFAFQAHRGFLYRQIGLLNGVFMAGLAGGSFLALRRTTRGDAIRPWLVASETSLIAWPLLLGAVLQLLTAISHGFWPPLTDFLYALLAAASGFLVGFQFPLFSLSHPRAERTPGKFGGLYYFLDLIGSGTGVLLTAIWFIPLLGIWKTLFFCLELKTASWLILLAAGRKNAAPNIATAVIPGE
jgi:spermidine synthase